MPSRISLPKLSLFSSSRHSSPVPPSSSSPPSLMASGLPAAPPPPPPTPTPAPTPATRTAGTSSTSPTPMSPPARLHLRNILPASPDEPPIMPPPPREPRAWVWQCHRCLNVYRLGCTRRCLDCSHEYCVSGPKTSVSSSSRGKKRRRAAAGLCGAEFDYVGWEQWGSWRRKVLGYEAAGRCDPVERDRAFLRRRHDCWIDCDSPSECCHRRFELAAELLRARKFLAEAQEQEQNQNQPPVIIGSPPLSPDDDIPPNEALAPEEGGAKDEGASGSETREEEKALKSPKSPLGQSSFLWDDDDDDETDVGKTKEEEEEEEIWWAAMSSPTDDNEERKKNSSEDAHDWATDVYDKVSSGSPDKHLTEDDSADDSDSDSESVRSGWSSTSSTSDNSSVGLEADGKAS
ncbi:hypothetical protein GGS24DRAFT_220906 [Hypoxylon argillaceum]|nr:hypothetical protein GGS24DRAFT_220906 [Hypoxylon argillaceum]